MANNVEAELVTLIRDNPDYKIVTDVGASMCSGWGNLIQIEVHDDVKKIELFFD